MSIRACVTGATGYLGGGICRALSDLGVNVKATVRNLDDAKNQFLTKIPNVTLTLLKDVTSEEECLNAFKDCQVVVAVAQPGVADAATAASMKTQEDIDRYVQQTIQLTASTFRAAKAAGVKRIVLTATMASICGSQLEKDPHHIWNDTDWNDAPGSYYSAGKTAGEREAWRQAKELDIELTTIHPAFVLGPLQPGQPPSSTIGQLLNVFKGIFPGPNKFGIVDIRDVASAHAVAATQSTFGKRYLLNNADQYSSVELVQLAQQVSPALTVSIPPEYTALVGRKPACDPAGAEALLGRPLIAPLQSLKDAFESFKTEKLL